MQEDFLHFIWKNKKFTTRNLKTGKGEPINILHLGQHNQLAGPDFFNAKIEINGQLWAGNVEIHLKASDWFVHGHEADPNYNNVILHVVWEDDVEVYRKDGTVIPCLSLKNYVDTTLLGNHERLMKKKKFINCEKRFGEMDGFLLSNLYERLFIERLEEKSKLIFQLLEASKNDWEKVLFCLLMKNFGLNHNGTIFLEVAKSIDFSVFRKVQDDVLKSESLFFGMLGLLENQEGDEYYQCLKNEFEFLKKKFRLKNELLPKPNFYGLRPNNFPTIRLSQLVNLYAENGNLFQKIIDCNDYKSLQSILKITATTYWDNHYVFGKESSKRVKKLTDSFIDLLLINTVIPLKFCYAKIMGKTSLEDLLVLARDLKPENNSIINKFDSNGKKTENAFESQAKLQLYNFYCEKNLCLKCAVGNRLLLVNS